MQGRVCRRWRQKLRRYNIGWHNLSSIKYKFQWNYDTAEALFGVHFKLWRGVSRWINSDRIKFMQWFAPSWHARNEVDRDQRKFSPKICPFSVLLPAFFPNTVTKTKQYSDDIWRLLYQGTDKVKPLKPVQELRMRKCRFLIHQY